MLSKPCKGAGPTQIIKPKSQANLLQVREGGSSRPLGILGLGLFRMLVPTSRQINYFQATRTVPDGSHWKQGMHDWYAMCDGTQPGTIAHFVFVDGSISHMPDQRPNFIEHTLDVTVDITITHESTCILIAHCSCQILDHFLEASKSWKDLSLKYVSAWPWKYTSVATLISRGYQIYPCTHSNELQMHDSARGWTEHAYYTTNIHTSKVLKKYHESLVCHYAVLLQV